MRNEDSGQSAGIRALGFDLGAARVRVAAASRAGAALAVWPEGPWSCAALSVSNGQVLYGSAALARFPTHPQDTVLEPLAVVGGPEVVLQGNPFPGEQLLAWWVEKAVATAGTRVDLQAKVVACVSWDQKQVLHPAMATAASWSGVQLLTTAPPTTAAAIWHAMNTGLTDGSLLVVDAGARKVEIAIVRIQPGKLSVLGRACDRKGGSWLDDALADSCLRELFPGLDPRRMDPTRRALLRLECERARRALADQPRVQLHIPLTAAGGPSSGPATEVTRKRLEDLARPLKEGIIKALRQVLADAQLGPDSLHDVIAVGGLSHMQLVDTVLRDVLGRSSSETDRDGASARGAALLAATMTGIATVSAVRPANPSMAMPAVSNRAKETPAPTSVDAGETRPSMRAVDIAPPKQEAPPAVQVVAAPSSRAAPPLSRSPAIARAPLSSSIPREEPASEPPTQRASTVPSDPSRAPTLPGMNAAAPTTMRAPLPKKAEVAHPTLRSPVVEDPTARGKGAEPDREPEGRHAIAPPLRPSVEMLLGAVRQSRIPEIRESPKTPEPPVTTKSPPAPERAAASGVAEAARKSSVPPIPMRDSAPPSIPVPGSRGSIPPGVLVPMEGTFVVPRSAADLLKLPLRRALAQEDLNPISLPLLFISLSRRKDLSGVLELSRQEGSVSAKIAAGGLVWDSPKQKDVLLTAFNWERGSYRMLPQERKAQPEVKGESLSKTALEGMRVVLRQEREQGLEEALKDKLSLSPKVSSRGAALAEAVGFWTAEKRFLKYQCDGSLTGYEATKSSGVSKFTALQVMLLIDLFGEISWGAPLRKAAPSIAEQVESRAKDIGVVNHYELLGLHWSADEHEVLEAFKRLAAEYGPGTEAFRQAPEAARALMNAAAVARDTLANRTSRVEYLRKIKPDLDYLAIAELLRTRAEALDLKGMEKEVRETNRLRSEVDPLARAANREIDVNKFK